MADTGVRVALLARAGTARDQLHRALTDAGAQIVAEGDPAELDPAQVAAHAPTVFLVSLEPAIEKSLDRFDELLAAPGIEVMFDDAEVTGRLEGWDLNRWARHVASKLLGAEGLPPAPGGSMALPEAGLRIRPGAPPTPAELMDHARLEDYTADTSALADSVPVSPSLMSPAAGEELAGAASETNFSWEEAPPSGEHGNLELDTDLGIDLDLSGLESTQYSAAPESAAASEPLAGGQSVRFSSFGQEPPESTLGDLDADVAALAAQLEAFEKNDQRFAAVEPSFESAPKAREPVKAAKTPIESVAAVAVPVTAPRAAASFDFSNLALAPIEGELPPSMSAKIVPDFAASAAALEIKTAAPAVRSVPDAEGLGAVLILAGLGGPDAVRQLLSSLPDKLKVPVVLYQHLEVGKHERLVEQLAKISRLPVVLARDGAAPEPGKVSLLPAGLTAIASGNSLCFAPGTLSQLITALPAQQSMIIVLSGADIQLVPLIASVREQGGLVLAQDPEVCFDPGAAEAMRGEGAAVYPALGLARQIAARWPL